MKPCAPGGRSLPDAEVVSFDVDSAEPYPAGREAAGARTPGLQVVDAFVKPVQDLAVAGGQGHVELGSWLGGRLVEDGVDEPPSGAGREVAGPDMEGGGGRLPVGIGGDRCFGDDVAVVMDGEVLGTVGHG